MKKTIIHIGIHKTATTFFQNNVWPFISGYNYLTRPFTQHNWAFNHLQYADDSLYNKNIVFDELNQLPSAPILISDESLSGKPIFFSYINRSIIANRLKEIFPNAEIILFIRDQKDIILSHYSSYLKMPYGNKKIEKLFYRPNCNYSYAQYISKPKEYNSNTLYYNTNDYYIHLDCFLYSKLIKTYINLFEKCHIFLFEDFINNKNSTFSRLEQIFGQKIVIKSHVPENVSISHSDCRYYRFINQFPYFRKKSIFYKSIKFIMEFIPNKDCDIRKAVHNIVRDYYSDDNLILKSLLPEIEWDKLPDKYN